MRPLRYQLLHGIDNKHTHKSFDNSALDMRALCCCRLLANANGVSATLPKWCNEFSYTVLIRGDVMFVVM
jgi:hypothetical protein